MSRWQRRRAPIGLWLAGCDRLRRRVPADRLNSRPCLHFGDNRAGVRRSIRRRRHPGFMAARRLDWKSGSEGRTGSEGMSLGGFEEACAHVWPRTESGALPHRTDGWQARRSDDRRQSFGVGQTNRQTDTLRPARYGTRSGFCGSGHARLCIRDQLHAMWRGRATDEYGV